MLSAKISWLRENCHDESHFMLSRVILVKKAQKNFLDGFGTFWKKNKFFFHFFYSEVVC